jgi:hypothetical protein
MSVHNSSLVNLSIPQEVTQPIVAANIQEAVLAALGGSEKIVEGIIHRICNEKVDPKTGRKPDYSSTPTVSWMDYQVTGIIEKAVEVELKKQLDAGALPIKEALIKVMQSKAGSSKIADGVLAGLTGSFSGENFIPSIKIEFEKKRTNNW